MIRQKAVLLPANFLKFNEDEFDNFLQCTSRQKPAKIGRMYSCWCTQCTHSVHTVHTQCTHSVHTVYTRQQSYDFGAGSSWYSTAVPLACTMHGDSFIGSSTSSSEFSTWMFLRSQIYPIFENLMTFLKVPGRFSTSWNSESLRKL